MPVLRSNVVATLPSAWLGPAAVAPQAAGARLRGDALAQAERKVLREVLEGCRWNVSLAATQLNISRRTLHRKLKAHGMRRYSAWEASRGD